MALPQLAMSSTKDDLLKHLDLPIETYALMAKETDRVYMWLTSDKNHLKSNCKRKPPYDWSDIRESSKDQAMGDIARGGDQYTSYYWRLALPTEDCPNWIARWFLYHKFRYRDGRNRTSQRTSDDRKPHHESKSGKHKSRHQHADYTGQDNYYKEGSVTIGTSSTYYPQASSSSGVYYAESSQPYDVGSSAVAAVAVAADSQSSSYYDPVRDI